MDNLVPHKYGELKFLKLITISRNYEKKIFWLVLYTDKNTKEDFENIDVVKYHKNLLFEISNCNKLLLYPKDFVEIINSLECALSVLQSEEFDFNKYKKLVFDAGALLQRMKVGDE